MEAFVYKIWGVGHAVLQREGAAEGWLRCPDAIAEGGLNVGLLPSKQPHEEMGRSPRRNFLMSRAYAGSGPA